MLILNSKNVYGLYSFVKLVPKKYILNLIFKQPAYLYKIFKLAKLIYYIYMNQ